VAPRFVVGIDLGTTNSALAWVDSSESEERPRVRLQQIPQLVSPGEIAHRSLLPSFLYVPGELDFAAGSTGLPWDPQPRHVTGELARRRGAENPTRLVASAKSWLSYGGASRTAPILPWGAPDDVPHISPVDAAAEYLRHLASAFDTEIAA
jgi:molecular chaperone DnaK (HSP70)